ncbi:MAG: hypothetical protein ACP5NC_08075, partial [Nitrososphaeria archaeon]
MISSNASATGYASGSFTVLPNVVPAGIAELEEATPVIAISSSTASVPASSIIYFWWSTTSTASPSGSYYFAGSASSTAQGTLAPGTSWVSQYYSTANSVPGSLTGNPGTPTSPGTYYLLATAGGTTPANAPGVAVSGPITVVLTSVVTPPNLSIATTKSSLSPSVYSAGVSSIPVTVGQTVYFEGTGYTSSSVSVYIGNVVNGSVVATVPVVSSGIQGSFTVPQLAQGIYYVIAYDASGTGMTAMQEISVGPAVTYSGSIPAY